MSIEINVSLSPRQLRLIVAELEMAVTEHHDEARRDEVREVLQHFQVLAAVVGPDNAAEDEQCDATDSGGVRCEMSVGEHAHAAPEALQRFLRGNRT